MGARPGGEINTGQIVNYLGGVLSLVLLAGGIVWGTKLIMRDVSGIPVVQATQGAMRVTPEDPGGIITDHEGLSVNAVAAAGPEPVADGPILLAPKDVEPPQQDLVAVTTPQVNPSTGLPSAPLGLADGQGVVEQILSDPSFFEDETQEPLPLTDPAPGADVSVLAVAAAPRPVARSAGLRTASAPQATLPAATQGADIPVGAAMVQLGAFDSDAVAQEQWARISSIMGEFFAGKRMVVQRAQTQGKVFYRLRVAGFDDMGGARRFCSTLKARQVDCIPAANR